MRSWLISFLLPLILLAGGIAYWAAQSPVGAGIYPARLGGARYVLC